VFVPEGTVLTVRTDTPLNSQSARVGQAFRTTVSEALDVDGYTVIPRGSSINGQITLARIATSRQSGMIGVEFTQLVLPDGRTTTMYGKLTSTDPEERRQIDAQGDARVVFIGGRSGFGTAIGAIGAGSANDPVGGLLGALGTILSEGTNVNVPAGTVIAVQLESGVTLTGSQTIGDALSTIFTSTTMVRSAQQALRNRNYYRGPVDGRLTNDTRRALFEFQIDNEIYATGNLDMDTAEALGIDMGGVGGGTAMTPTEAAELRRNAQTVTGTWRDYISITPAGRLSPSRTYQPAELELYFALSAFADNTSLYEQMVRGAANPRGVEAATASLIGSARRVDQALGAMRVPTRTLTLWRTTQTQLREIDARYPR
jgi:peptidoglycan hydrolase-like protein with peptidoglycan-binding domain